MQRHELPQNRSYTGRHTQKTCPSLNRILLKHSTFPKVRHMNDSTMHFLFDATSAWSQTDEDQRVVCFTLISYMTKI